MQSNDSAYASFVNSFIDKISDLKLLADCSADSTSVDQMDKILTTLEKQVADLDSYVKSEKQYISQIQKLRNDAERQRDYVLYKLEPKLPAVFSQQPVDQQSIQPTLNLEGYQSESAIEEEPPKSVQKSASKKRKREEDVEERLPVIKTITAITDSDLSDVPKYMKGRTTSPKLNQVVAEINTCVEKKYQLLVVPEQKLSHSQVSKRKQLKRDTEKYESQMYFTEADLAQHSKFKMDAIGKTCIQILRHLKRIKEVRKTGSDLAYIIL